MQTIKPVFRIFDHQKAIEFYCGWLGFEVVGEHRFGENFPLYLRIQGQGIEIHLSEHHGDCSPGAKIHIENVPSLIKYHAALLLKDYKYNKPGIQKAFWDSKLYLFEVIDPFGNKIIFTGKE